MWAPATPTTKQTKLNWALQTEQDKPKPEVVEKLEITNRRCPSSNSEYHVIKRRCITTTYVANKQVSEKEDAVLSTTEETDINPNEILLPALKELMLGADETNSLRNIPNLSLGAAAAFCKDITTSLITNAWLDTLCSFLMPVASMSEEVQVALHAQAARLLGALGSTPGETRDKVMERLEAAERELGVAGPLELKRAQTAMIAQLAHKKARIRKPALLAALLNQLVADDVRLLQNSIWAISNITNNSGNEELQQLIDHGSCGRIMALTNHEEGKIAEYALRVLSNICSGNDLQTQYVVNEGLVGVLVTVMQHSPSPAVQKDACWAMSNIMAGNVAQIQIGLDQGALPLLIRKLSDSVAIAAEACWAISNATSGCSVMQRQAILAGGAFRALTMYAATLLRSAHSRKVEKSLEVALQGLKNLSRKQLIDASDKAAMNQMLASISSSYSTTILELKTDLSMSARGVNSGNRGPAWS